MRGLNQIIIGLALTVAIWAAPEINTEWSKADCLPGDVVELRVSVSSDHVTSFDLKLPANDALEWVAHDRGPLLYQAGIYSQKDVVIAQPTRAGTIQLKDLHAIVQDGEIKTDRTLTVQALVVGTYGATEDTYNPEPLPVAKTRGKTSRWAVLWIGLCLLALALLVRVFRKKPQQVVTQTESPPLLVELAGLLENRDVAVAPIEKLLVERRQEFSGDLRVALERFVYGGSRDLDGLRVLLGKEAKR